MKKTVLETIAYCSLAILVILIVVGLLFTYKNKKASVLYEEPMVTATPEGSLLPSPEDSPTPLVTPDPAPTPTPVVLDRYKDILNINPFVAGHLYIEGVGLDEPVFYTPNLQNYFLHRDTEGNYSAQGSLFIAALWKDEYHNTLIYGHNMKSGAMFGALYKFADESFGKKNPVIRFDTLYEEREYELAYVFYTSIPEEEIDTEEDQKNDEEELNKISLKMKKEKTGDDSLTEDDLELKDLYLYEDYEDIDIYRDLKDEDNGRLRFYYYTDLSDEEDYEYYVSECRKRALYDTGVTVDPGDDLLTLSTCAYQVKNGRLVLVAVRTK